MVTPVRDHTFEERLIPMLRMAVEEKPARKPRPRWRVPSLIASIVALLAITSAVWSGLAIGRGEIGGGRRP